MGLTLQVRPGLGVDRSLTCDSCGGKIDGPPVIDLPSGPRDYPRYRHAECPGSRDTSNPSGRP
jgi:hypothetical protein